MPILKLCGLMRPEDVALCCALGVDIAGFVVDYPVPVPWNLRPETAARLMGRLTGGTQSCIVTGGDPSHVLALAERLQPDMVQLHYRETLEETVFLARELEAMGIRTVKAIPVRPDGGCDMEGFDTPQAAARALAETAISMLLLDARCASRPGESRTLDPELYRAVAAASPKPVMLAGGLHAGNLAEVLAAADPVAVDILSGAERAPGEKDPEQVRAICRLCGTFHGPAAGCL